MTDAETGSEWTPLFVLEPPYSDYPTVRRFFRCRGCNRYSTATPNAEEMAFTTRHRRYCPAWKEKRVQYVNGKWWMKGEPQTV